MAEEKQSSDGTVGNEPMRGKVKDQKDVNEDETVGAMQDGTGTEKNDNNEKNEKKGDSSGSRSDSWIGYDSGSEYDYGNGYNSDISAGAVDAA
jgi:hypothetical protein